jgi:hypothetical protein
VLDILVVAIIYFFYMILYLIGIAGIEFIVVVTSLGVMWIMIRLIAIQYIVEELESQVKRREEK